MYVSVLTRVERAPSASQATPHASCTNGKAGAHGKVGAAQAAAHEGGGEVLNVIIEGRF